MRIVTNAGRASNALTCLRSTVPCTPRGSPSVRRPRHGRPAATAHLKRRSGMRRGLYRGGSQGPTRGGGKKGRRGRLKGKRGRGTFDTEKPPLFGIIPRGGDVGIRRLANVQHVTIKPLIQATMLPGTWVSTDAYAIYSRLEQWGYGHASVCHSRGEYARDDDGDGFHAVHVNTREGFWSLLRSWLRPHRGISQDNLPLYLGFFAFVHNVRRRGKALLGARLELLLT
jgi:transposase-like protein